MAFRKSTTMSSTASQSSRQRLPPDFFMCPDLSSAAQWDLVRRSQQALVDLTQKTRLHGGPITWTLDHESNGVLVYRGNDPFLPLEASSVLLRVTDVRGTLDDMAELLRQPDGAATYHKALTVDCQTLYRIQPPVPQNTSSLVVQWRGLQPSSVHRRRDVCMLEYQDAFSMDGVGGVGECVQSIDLPSVCPDLQQPLGFVRGYIHLGGTVCFPSTLRRGCVTVSQLYQTDWNGLLPPWLSRWLTSETPLVAKLDAHLHHTRLVNAFFRSHPPTPLRPSASGRGASQCAVCTGRFFLCVRTKYTCHPCSQAVCHRCSRRLVVDGYHARVCVPCMSTAINNPAHAITAESIGSSRRQSNTNVHGSGRNGGHLLSSLDRRTSQHEDNAVGHIHGNPSVNYIHHHHHQPPRPTEPQQEELGHHSIIRLSPPRPSIDVPGWQHQPPRGSCLVIDDDGATTIPFLVNTFDGADRGSSVAAPLQTGTHYMYEPNSHSPPQWMQSSMTFPARHSTTVMMMMHEDGSVVDSSTSSTTSSVDYRSNTATVDHRVFESTRGCIDLE